ncbi:hypothetical protein TSUD_262010 [Trifolium subterraneum]|nr:hypothetical protein TSUD_262010 [Trifolium subterraneum]
MKHTRYSLVNTRIVTSLVVPPGGKCAVPCIATCDKDCRAKGFKYGGCYSRLEKTTCCCFH